MASVNNIKVKLPYDQEKNILEYAKPNDNENLNNTNNLINTDDTKKNQTQIGVTEKTILNHLQENDKKYLDSEKTKIFNILNSNKSKEKQPPIKDNVSEEEQPPLPQTGSLQTLDIFGKGLTKATSIVKSTKPITLLGKTLGDYKQNEIVTILKKTNRNVEEIQTLYDYLKKLFFFKKFVSELVGEGGDDMIKSLIGEVTIEEYPENTVIFEENAPSNDKMYVVLSGAFAVYKQKKANVFEEDYEKMMTKKTIADEGEMKKTKAQDDKTKKSKKTKQEKDTNNKMSVSPSCNGSVRNTRKESSDEKTDKLKPLISPKSMLTKSRGSRMNSNKNFSRKNIQRDNTISEKFDNNNVLSSKRILKTHKSDYIRNTIVSKEKVSSLSKFATTTNELPFSTPKDSPQFSCKDVNLGLINHNLDRKLLSESNLQVNEKNIKLQPYNAKNKNSALDDVDVQLEEDALEIDDNYDRSSESIEVEKSIKEILEERYGERIIELKEGIMFGELAQLKNAPRNATIVLTKDTQLVILHKKQFDLIKQYFATEMLRKKEFIFSVMPNLKEINADKYVIDIIESLANRSQLKGFKLTEQDVVQNEMYFLREGTCKIQYKLPSGKAIDICEVKEGSILGEECQFYDECKYTTIVTSNEVKMYTLPLKFCRRSLPAISLQYIMDGFEKKDKYRMNKMEKLVCITKTSDYVDSTNPQFYVQEHLMAVKRRIKSLSDNKTKSMYKDINEFTGAGKKNNKYMGLRFQDDSTEKQKRLSPQKIKKKKHEANSFDLIKTNENLQTDSINPKKKSCQKTEIDEHLPKHVGEKSYCDLFRIKEKVSHARHTLVNSLSPLRYEKNKPVCEYYVNDSYKEPSSPIKNEIMLTNQSDYSSKKITNLVNYRASLGNIKRLPIAKSMSIDPNQSSYNVKVGLEKMRKSDFNAYTFPQFLIEESNKQKNDKKLKLKGDGKTTFKELIRNIEDNGNSIWEWDTKNIFGDEEKERFLRNATNSKNNTDREKEEKLHCSAEETHALKVRKDMAQNEKYVSTCDVSDFMLGQVKKFKGFLSKSKSMLLDHKNSDLQMMPLKQDIAIVQANSKSLKQTLTDNRLKQITNSCIRVGTDSKMNYPSYFKNEEAPYFRVSNNNVFLGTLTGNDRRSKVLSQSYGAISIDSKIPSGKSNNKRCKSNLFNMNPLENSKDNIQDLLKDLDCSANNSNYNWEKKEYLRSYMTRSYMNSRVPYKNKPISDTVKSQQMNFIRNNQPPCNNVSMKKIDEEKTILEKELSNNNEKKKTMEELVEVRKSWRKASSSINKPISMMKSRRSSKTKILIVKKNETQFYNEYNNNTTETLKKKKITTCTTAEKTVYAK